MLLKPKATARCLTQETLPMIHTFGYIGYVDRVSYDSRFHDHESGLFSLVIQRRWIIPVLAWTWSKCGFLMPLKKAVTCAQWQCNPKEDARHVVVQRQDCWEASLEHLVYDVFGPLWRWHTKLTSATATSGRVSKDVHRQQKTVGLETVQDLCLCCQSGSSKMHDMTMLQNWTRRTQWNYTFPTTIRRLWTRPLHQLQNTARGLQGRCMCCNVM